MNDDRTFEPASDGATCVYCGEPVPQWLRDIAGPEAIWCSGRCMALRFTPLREHLREALRAHAGLPRLQSPRDVVVAVEVIIAALRADRVTSRNATVLLYALQTALSALRQIKEESDGRTPAGTNPDGPTSPTSNPASDK